MRKSWTDERLDDLSQRVTDGFTRVDADLREIRAGINAVNARFDSLHRLIIQVGGSTLAAVVVSTLLQHL